ncbi:MAG: ferritin family protein [Candidatus Margulisbacteria bacterium]|nr:ferritin family protein [Candidatus Margulisiibacteriota bacterium]MBU1616578.1 ferritin family protein [Candidatus Margulisiibacteriota bacterium]
MAGFFHADEVLQGAIKIEENGEELYRSLSEQSDDPVLKELFTSLADQEVGHRELFKAMLKKLGQVTLPESYPDEYHEYLKAFAREHVFTAERKDPRAGLAIALQAEVDSILYYLELKNMVPEADKKVVDQVVEEERRHYLRLLKIKAGK